LDKVQIIESLFYSILTYTYLLAPVLLLIFWNKLRQEKWAFWVPLYSFLFFFLVLFEEEITTTKFSTKLYYQSFTFFEYLFFTGIFWYVIKSRAARIIIVILSVSFSTFQIVYFFTERFKRIDSIPIGIESILVLIYIFYFFYELLKEPKGRHLSENYCFWFAIGILIYLSGSFFINILANVMEKDAIIKYWFLTYIADIIKNICLAIGLIVMARHAPSQEGVKKNLPYLDMN
jgi:hypothetical protein